ncbi:uncharacterized protein DUF4264 [Desulfitobacterium sp. LBE]|uniref:DUF4264 domain-containing protein n=5 Tax=root TaxID=1 RepID=Q24WH9_DESHY|nr:MULTISPECIES: YpmA family protein [Desulfitobacterium]ACL21002.1 conserved hypothetical protein [Desulfitobacterium hafniense DCB-2]MEA5025427.1 YpmA family protein [Desulfitobacterium hafniense]TWH56178.1 uncharacterized protein DUF4264 [Desulfitobacterium sp. LBE]CDX01888.1 Protein of unknown function (DUF4264) [Desulfitobacterium hafniense]BAE83613.1 hypothetical protein DSY1824 [Desulfitobacterium hafniense Y51]
MDQKTGKIELIGTQKLKINPELYKVVDFLNKNLKEHNLMFGLSKKENTMTMAIYEVE